MRRRADWKAVALRRAYEHTVAVQGKQKYVDMGRIQMNVGDRFLGLLAQAAEKRGLSVGAYCRRAVAAFVAADLGADLADVVSDTAHPRGYRYASADDGLGFGEWVASPFTDDTGVV